MRTIATITLMFMGVLAAHAGTPIRKNVPVTHVYSPFGFDTNDSAEVVITGFLPNLCHKSPSAKVKINGKKIEVEVSSLYYQESNPFCPEMVVPFVESVDLGALDRGEYEITVNSGTQWQKKDKVRINEATSNSVDEFSYAYVQYIEKEDVRAGHVKLKGYNPSDCFELEKIEYVHNGKDTYSIMPKMKQVRGFCPRKMVPFEYEFKVPEELEAHQVLLHVRSMDGRSVNTLYYR